MASLTIEPTDEGWRWRIDEPPTRGGLDFADREDAREAGRIFADWIDVKLELPHD